MKSISRKTKRLVMLVALTGVLVTLALAEDLDGCAALDPDACTGMTDTGNSATCGLGDQYELFCPTWGTAPGACNGVHNSCSGNTVTNVVCTGCSEIID